MQRKLLQQLLAWKNSDKRLPLLLEGARQVGKTLGISGATGWWIRKCNWVEEKI